MNLKSFLLAFGLLGTSATAATATACSCSTKHDTTDQDTVNFINGYSYTAEIDYDDSNDNRNYGYALQQITPDFVKEKIPSPELRTRFNQSSVFTLIEIKDESDTRVLTDADFNKPDGSVIKANFHYDYGKFKDQKAAINFPIITSTQQKVINAINSNIYESAIDVNSSYADIGKIITGETELFEFISDGLPDELKPPVFDSTKFSLVSITDDNWEMLNDSSLKTHGYGEMDVKINYIYFRVKDESTNLHLRVIANDEDNIVKEINQVSDYQYTIPVKSRYGDLEFDITSTFIKDKLTGNQKTNFDENAISINSLTDENGVELTDADFQTVRPMNVKINYDYGSIKNQNTNLALNIEKMHLDVELRGFKVRDRKNVVGYLNGNLGSILRDQIKEYLSIPDFEGAGLEFVNQKINSIDVHAKESSEEYQGQITLTWNLKLFEVWGLGVGGETDSDFKNGLKGYFYLENGTNKVKYFDVYGFMAGRTAEIHHYITNYHRFTFKKNTAPTQTKDFTFNGTWYTNTIENRFGSFDFVPGMAVTINSTEASRIKFFNPNTGQWNDTLTGRTYIFNSLGQITTIPK